MIASGGFDAVLLPLGNGALLTGVARWIKAHQPTTKIFGVSSVHAPAMHDGAAVHHAGRLHILVGAEIKLPLLLLV